MDSSLNAEPNTLPAQPSGGLPPEVRALIDLRMPKWQRFVEHYCVSGNAHAAALAAGYAPVSAKQRGQELLHRPEAKAAIARVRTALAERNRYTLDKALVEIDGDLEGDPSGSGQWSAVSNLQRIKQQLCGHLIERIDARVMAIPFSIVIRGIDEPRQAIEGESQEVSP